MNRELLKRGLIGLLALVCLVFSLWVLTVSARNVLFGGMHLRGVKQSFIYFTTLAMCCWLGWLSVRGLRIAAGVVPLHGPRFKMWRLFVGVLLVPSVAQTIFVPSSRRYQADNAAEAIGMYTASIVVFALVLLLMRSAFPRWQGHRTMNSQLSEPQRDPTPPLK